MTQYWSAVIKSLNISIFHSDSLFIHSFIMNRNEFLQLTVIYLSILQFKLVFLLPQGNFTRNFSVCIITRERVKWLQANLPGFTVIQQIEYYQL